MTSVKIQLIVNSFANATKIDDRHEFSMDSSRELNMDHPIIYFIQWFFLQTISLFYSIFFAG